jgi:hypothetical protein
LHSIDSTNTRVLCCDRNSDSPRLRPLSLSSPFSFATWVTLVSLWILCAIASSFAKCDMRSVARNWTIVLFIKTTFNSLFEFILCLVEKDVGKENCTKAFIGLIVICLGNDYKNYLTIQLVLPRASDAIGSFTELLDLNFTVLQLLAVKEIGYNKSTWLKDVNYQLEKREKHLREVETWLTFILHYEENMINELAPVTSKSAWILTAHYFVQLHTLKLIKDRNYPTSCNFVKRPSAHQFREFYFLNPKDEFKWWTEKFLDHGLFEFWKRLHIHMLTLYERHGSFEKCSNNLSSSLVEAVNVQNFIGQVHLTSFYIVTAIITAICVVICVLECAMQNAQALSIYVVNNFKHFSLQLLWTIVLSLSLMRRQIGRVCQNPNRSQITLDRSRIDNISVNKIHKIEVKPKQ